MNKKEKQLVQDLLDAIEKNSTGLWVDDLSETADCVILNTEHILEGDNPEPTYYTGINYAITNLTNYLNAQERSAIEKAKEEKLDYRVYSPVPNHDLEDATLPGKSPVRFITFLGALSGLIFGFSLAILTSMDYPLRVSSKDIVSVPGFVVIGYECTILFGGIATLKALLFFCGIPNIFKKVGFDPRFTKDKFGVVIGCPKDRVDELEKAFSDIGADEVQVRDGI